MRTLSKTYGVTLLETLISIAIVSILASITVPSYQQLQLKLIHRANANNIEDFLQQARQKATYLKQDIFVSVNVSALCLGASMNKQCDCAIASLCDVDNSISTLYVDTDKLAFTQLAFAQPSYFKFNAHLGTAAGGNGSFVLSSAVAKIRVIVSTLGRTRTCLIEGNIGGVVAC